MPDYNWISEDIFTIDELLTREECAHYIELSESLGYEDAPINTAFGPQRRPDVRNNLRVMLDDRVRADDLWSRVHMYVPLRRGDWTAIGVNERLRFYRYHVGQQFDWHYDGCFERENGERSFLTFMVYLNEEFLGGETRFADPTTMPSLQGGGVVPRTGLALIFAHPLLHKGEMVVQGCKYVLRTDVMYRLETQRSEDFEFQR